MSSEQEFISPVEQETVLFFGQPVIAVRLLDGRIGAVINNMCSILKMDVASQVRRLREDETTADSLVQVQIQTETRGTQIMGILVAWAIPYWLSNIQLSRIRDGEKREAIAYFKEKQLTSSMPISRKSLLPYLKQLRRLCHQSQYNQHKMQMHLPGLSITARWPHSTNGKPPQTPALIRSRRGKSKWRTDLMSIDGCLLSFPISWSGLDRNAHY